MNIDTEEICQELERLQNENRELRMKFGAMEPQPAVLQDLDLSGPVDLVVLSVKARAVRCRLLESDHVITLRATRFWDLVPGEIVTIRPHKKWSYAGHPYLSGKIDASRLDIAAINLIPLKLRERGLWDPNDQYWGEESDGPINEDVKSIIAYGPRPEFEMEQVLPGADPDDPFSDPITESNDLRESKDGWGAHKILMNLCQSDLRFFFARDRRIHTQQKSRIP